MYYGLQVIDIDDETGEKHIYMPKIILDDRINTNEYWSDDEVLSFTHQLLLFVLEQEKF